MGNLIDLPDDHPDLEEFPVGSTFRQLLTDDFAYVESRRNPLLDWLASDIRRGTFVSYKCFVLYMHRPVIPLATLKGILPHLVYDVCIGSVRSIEHGSGLLGEMLDLIETGRIIKVESVLNPRLERHLKNKRGYSDYTKDQYPPDLIKRPATHGG